MNTRSPPLGPLKRDVATSFLPSQWRLIPALAPYARWLARFEQPGDGRWPDVENYASVLGTEVLFVEYQRRMPVGLDASDVDRSYIGACLHGKVPTRHGNLHDFLNALTWARFPSSKLVLVARLAEIARARGLRTNRLRLPAQDRLSMVDEGGILEDPTGNMLLFGHGLLEDAVEQRRSRGLTLPVATFTDDQVAEAIRALPLEATRTASRIASCAASPSAGPPRQPPTLADPSQAQPLTSHHAVGPVAHIEEKLPGARDV